MGELTLRKTTVWNAAALAVGLSIAMASHPIPAATTEELPGAAGIAIQNDANSAAITFGRPSGGITQISIERLNPLPSAYVTVITASGPTRDDAAVAAAALRTFTNLTEQASFVGIDSISFAYNQPKPSYVISELERAKLISPVEAQAARTAFDSLGSQ